MGAFVFIESNTTGTGELFVQKVVERGETPYFLTANPAKYPFLRRLGAIVVSIDTADVEVLVRFVSALREVAGVFSSSDYFVQVASQVAERLGFATGNSEAIALCRDKLRLSEVLLAHQVLTPLCTPIDMQHLDAATLGALSYPLVIKPRNGSGSVAVRLCHDAEQVQAHCDAMERSGMHQALAQPYVRGAEFSVETVTLGGITKVLAVVEKRLGEEPSFVETGHTCPSQLPCQQRRLIEQAVLGGLQAVGFRFGPAHTEVRLCNDQVTVIEINPRLAGGLIPLMLEEVFEFDLLGYILDLWRGSKELPDLTAKHFGAIRFALPRDAGQLEAAITLPPEAAQDPKVRHFRALKQPGDHLSLRGDYRDRCAALICVGEQRAAVTSAADEYIQSVQIRIAKARPALARGSTQLPEELQRIIYSDGYPHQALADELVHLFDVNDAHLIMLGETGLVAADIVERVLGALARLRADGLQQLLARPRPRGLYMMLEHYLIELLGEDAGGALRTGRSRNDTNATITQLMLRSALGTTMDAMLALRRTLIRRASALVEQAFPIYSQYQPALPGTLSHQLLGFEHGVARESKALLAVMAELDTCPLGAGAGGGTTLPVDSELVAKLLGFAQPPAHSLDAVASRGSVLHLLASLNCVSVLLSRIAQDLQLWTTAECALVELPAEQCGASSMLPQKRNPFLIEFVKGRACVPSAALLGCTGVLSKVPYTNSFEVNSQVNRFIAEATTAVVDSLVVTDALIEGMQPNPQRIDAVMKDTAVVSAAVAEAMVAKQKMSFRAAYERVASTVREARASARPAEPALAELEADLVRMTPLAWAGNHAYGGGPGSSVLPNGVARACNELALDGARLRDGRRAWEEAEQMRRGIIEQLLAT